MGRIWLVVTALAGVIAAPFLAEGIHALIEDGPAWFPFLVVLVLGSVAMLAGEFTKGVAWGMIVGVVAFAALLAWAPGTIEFLDTDVPAPF